MRREAEKPVAGVPKMIEPGVRCLLAPNPGPMTYWGTNTYLIGTGPVAIVDPGPDDPAHLEAIFAALGSASVDAILVTHAHRDHTGLAPSLADRTSAPVFGFGPPDSGRSEAMQRFSRLGGLGGGEGVDGAHCPDILVQDADVIAAGGADIKALCTPGHFSGHLSYQLGDLIFTGDVVMAWSTTLISPPDGDVRSFLTSAGRLRALRARRFLPGHGPAVEDPAARLDTLIAHRFAREAQIMAALATPGTAETLAALVYQDLDPVLLPAAARNTLAHLLDLWDRGLVVASNGPPDQATWTLT